MDGLSEMVFGKDTDNWKEGKKRKERTGRNEKGGQGTKCGIETKVFMLKSCTAPWERNEIKIIIIIKIKDNLVKEGDNSQSYLFGQRSFHGF